MYYAKAQLEKNTKITQFITNKKPPQKTKASILDLQSILGTFSQYQ